MLLNPGLEMLKTMLDQHEGDPLNLPQDVGTTSLVLLSHRGEHELCIMSGFVVPVAANRKVLRNDKLVDPLILILRQMGGKGDVIGDPKIPEAYEAHEASYLALWRLATLREKRSYNNSLNPTKHALACLEFLRFIQRTEDCIWLETDSNSEKFFYPRVI